MKDESNENECQGHQARKQCNRSQRMSIQRQMETKQQYNQY